MTDGAWITPLADGPANGGPHYYTPTQPKGWRHCAIHDTMNPPGLDCDSDAPAVPLALVPMPESIVHTAYEAAEITIQSMDRPTDDAEPSLNLLMAILRAVPSGNDPYAPMTRAVKLTGRTRAAVRAMVSAMNNDQNAASDDSLDQLAQNCAVTHQLQVMLTVGCTVDDLADEVMAEIRADMAEPFAWGKQIPSDVRSFSELHDYCDANLYGIYMPWYTDADNALLNAVLDECDRRIKAGLLADGNTLRLHDAEG